MKFNYIITIHNKEWMLERVLSGILSCEPGDRTIYAVLDGCSDNSEAVVDKVAQDYAKAKIVKVKTPDVHELLSINAGLKTANQDGEGFNIILQDDVVLADKQLELKIAKLYEQMGPKLGYVSLRMGANLIEDAANDTSPIPLKDFVENAYGHGIGKEPLYPGQFSFRDVPIKSPVCIPFKLIREIGMLDARLAPYAHDDTDYAIRCLIAGYRNGVYAIKFFSDVKWGGTRLSAHPEIGRIQKRNIKYIREWHRAYLESKKASPVTDHITIVPYKAEEALEAKAAWAKAQQALIEEEKKHTGIVSTAKKLLGNILGKTN